MSNAFATPLRLELQPSRQRPMLLLVVHLAVLLPIPWLQYPALQWAYAGIALGNLLRHLRVAQPVALLWHSTGEWSVDDQRQRRSATLAAPAYVQPWLVVLPLRFEHTNAIHRWLILPDMLDADSFRRLRVRLRTVRPQ